MEADGVAFEGSDGCSVGGELLGGWIGLQLFDLALQIGKHLLLLEHDALGILESLLHVAALLFGSGTRQTLDGDHLVGFAKETRAELVELGLDLALVTLGLAALGGLFDDTVHHPLHLAADVSLFDEKASVEGVEVLCALLFELLDLCRHGADVLLSIRVVVLRGRRCD